MGPLPVQRDHVHHRRIIGRLKSTTTVLAAMVSLAVSPILARGVLHAACSDAVARGLRLAPKSECVPERIHARAASVGLGQLVEEL